MSALPSVCLPSLSARLSRPMLGVLCLLGAVAATGCATPPKAGKHGESFASESPYQQNFEAPPTQTCEAARRALLSQGYLIGQHQETLVRGSKVFQPDPELHVEMEFTVTCVETFGGSMAFANAVQNRYELKKGASSAGVSVSALGSISLPWMSRADSLVKVGAETLSDPDLYGRFFNLTRQYLDGMPGVR